MGLSKRPGESRRLWVWGGVVLLLFVFWGRVLVNVPAQSLTVDEPVHLVRGLAYWRTGDLRLQYGHPPLAHALIGALPVLEPGMPSPEQMPGWSDADRLEIAHRFVWETADDIVARVTFLGRWAVVALGLLLAALSYRWANDLFGPRAGVLAVVACIFDPNLLAHSSLATTDLPVTCLIFGAGYAFSRWLRRPTASRFALAGVAIGLAWGAKMSSLVLLPVLGLAVVWSAWRRGRSVVKLLAGFSGLLAVSALILWAIYRFETGSIAGWWIPMPTHWDNLRRLLLHQSTGHLSYFLGQLSQEGWWYYFPVLFLIKTPLSLLLMVAAALGTMRQSPKSSPPALLILFVALYFAAAIVSNINIGYRHILPVVPFLGLIASALGRPGLWSSRGLGIVSVALVIWLAGSSLSVHPHYLTYFNEVVGGAEQGYRYAVDSNFDWGQDLKRLGRYAREEEVEDLKLSYFGTDRPSRYLKEFEVLSMDPFEDQETGFHPFNPDPGTYAISASHLQGLTTFDADVFDRFRHREPEAKVGSMFVYDVEPDASAPRWAALCGAPAPPLSREKVSTGLGQNDVRQVHFDCRSSWVYPAARGAGWYLFPGQPDGAMGVQRFLEGGKVVFQGRSARSRPALTVYRWDGATDLSDRLSHLSDGGMTANFGDLLVFLGSEREPVDDPGTPAAEVVLTTYWEVVSRPDQPLSIMAHLTDADGSVVAVADGLGVPVENWALGDVLAQVHTFAIPPNAALGPYIPRIGVYTLGEIEHLPLVDGTGDALSLTEMRSPGASGSR